jgi:hypothetical protein
VRVFHCQDVYDDGLCFALSAFYVVHHIAFLGYLSSVALSRLFQDFVRPHSAGFEQIVLAVPQYALVRLHPTALLRTCFLEAHLEYCDLFVREPFFDSPALAPLRWERFSKGFSCCCVCGWTLLSWFSPCGWLFLFCCCIRCRALLSWYPPRGWMFLSWCCVYGWTLQSCRCVCGWTLLSWYPTRGWLLQF